MSVVVPMSIAFSISLLAVVACCTYAAPSIGSLPDLDLEGQERMPDVRAIEPLKSEGRSTGKAGCQGVSKTYQFHLLDKIE